MKKSQELSDPKSCLNKAQPDELVFVLRAKDPLAPQTVRLWAAMARGVHETTKVNEALAWANSAEQWRKREFPDAKEDSNG